MENQLLDNDMLDNKEGKSLSALLANGYETNSVDYIKKGFEIFKQNIGPFIGFIIIVGIAEAIVGSIPFIKGLAGALVAPVIAGGFLVAKMIDKNETHSFSNFFDGTKNYVPLFLVTLLPTLLIGAILLVVGGWAYFKVAFLGIVPKLDIRDFNSLSTYASSMAGFGMRASLAGIISGVISILFLFGTFLVLFERFEPVRALDISRKLVSKKFFNWFGFLLLLGLFNAAGALCLLVGLFVTIPSTVCALYVAYEDVVGLNLRD
ncbi:MAG TPA: hypothetical protein PLX60_05570 [Chitinophagales bacterium]|jgi:hypothetical protein|nr:hypothetical protein [Chitinophagales bacterium]